MLRAVFELFTDNARQVVVLAQEEARVLKHNHIGTEHILLGLLRVDKGLAARVLGSLDITVVGVREQVVHIVGPGEEVVSGQIPFTPRAKKVLELALSESRSLSHNYIGTEHILLGLVRENQGVGARILREFDPDAEKIRNEIIRLLSVGPSGRGHGRGRAEQTQLARGGSIRVDLTTPVHELLMVAAARSLDERRTEIELRDLLLALTQDASTAPLLAELGIDESAMRNAIDSHHPGGEPHQGSPET